MVLMRFKYYTSFQGNGWLQSRVSLQLDTLLSSEKNYKLSYWVKDPPPPSDSLLCNEPLTISISIGISNYNNQFGTLIYTSPIAVNEWKIYSIIFNSQNAEKFLTIKADIGDMNYNDVFIDNFVLVETTEPVSVQEANRDSKHLIKIVDILGRESQPNATGLLFYIYSDGTVEKKVFVES